MIPFDRVVAQLAQQAGRVSGGAALLAVVALAGCATQPAGSQASAGASATPPLEVASEISKVAKDINAKLARLAEIEQASKKVVIPPRPKVTTGPLAKRVDVLWKSGPVEELLASIARDIGYQFRPVGQAPAIPLTARVDVEDVPLIDVLRSVGHDLGKSATVNVDPSAKVIEVIYASDR